MLENKNENGDAAGFGCEKSVCMENPPNSFILVIFGASGDLTYRKLIPSIFSLFQKDMLPSDFHIVGCARTPMDDLGFRKKVAESIRSKYKSIPAKMIDVFNQNVHYVSGAYDSPEMFSALSARLDSLDTQYPTPPGRIYYLALPASVYTDVIEQLSNAGLVSEKRDGASPYRRVIIEKPFGYDLESARNIERQMKNHLAEKQIYRIDHYLGKDTVQNILMLRFANMIFEPLWNNKYIDFVQITVAESIGIEHRAGYFDKAGLLRDIFQNHMLEMLSLVAMEPPASFDADSVRDEKAKLLRSIKRYKPEDVSANFIRGQYTQGTQNGEKISSYVEEDGVPQTSTTETFVAAKTYINNWRWNGVPFYLRAGKRLKRRVSEIAVTFKKIPHSIFNPLQPEDLHQNMLVLNVQPEEGFALNIQAKKPGAKLCMGDLPMDFFYRDIFKDEPPEAYERLLLDCMAGDSTLFIRNDTIDLSWSLLTPILEAWGENGSGAGKLCSYPAGSWGPKEAFSLIQADNRKWREP